MAPSSHTLIDELHLELKSMLELGMINNATHAAAWAYIRNDTASVYEMLESSSVTDVADTILDVVRSGCVNGKCN